MKKLAVKPASTSFSVIKPIDPVRLTQDLVRCRSVTPQDEGALDIVTENLSSMGFTVHPLRFEEEGTDPVDNIFARLGTDGPHLSFLGHTDVVPSGPEEDWKFPPFDAVIENGVLYGRGSADMKGCVAAFVAATSRFLANKTSFKGSISLLITGDEEGRSINGTAKVIEWMKDKNHIPDVALVGEPSNAYEMGQTIRIGRRGSFNALLTVRGIQGHSAYPERADNPILKMMKILDILSHTELDTGTDEFPPSHIVISSVDVGNPAPNIIPARATALINIRFNRLWNAEVLEDRLRDIIASSGIAYELKTWCTAESFMTEDGDWLQLVSQAVKKTSDRWPFPDTGGGTSDARFIAPYCPVVEYGLLNKTIHQVDERIALSDLEVLTQTYYEVLQSYFA
jgi:succinyl-diaminopimelate desuccinylase